jgi:hypothetical protein
VQDLIRARPDRDTRSAADIVTALAACVLVAAAFTVPLLASDRWWLSLYAASAPIFGSWLPHLGWGTGPAIALAALTVGYGPAVAARLPWRPLLWVAWLVCCAWAFSLAMVDGWQRGFAGRLENRNEYLYEVPGITDIPAMLRGFSGRILDFQPGSWTTHVAGHPPGAVLFFVLLNRVGLGGGGWAAVACTLIGCSAPVAVAVALRALDAEDRARAALPFLVLAPTAIWIAVSADAMFAGVTSWAVALLAIACRATAPRRERQARGGSARHHEGQTNAASLTPRVSAAVGAGLAFGLGVYLNYGLALMALPALAVLAAARTWRPAPAAAIGALAVAAAFTLSGFSWWDGYHLVIRRYYQGVGATRPFSYWVWGNLAATLCAVGPAAAPGLRRALSLWRALPRDPAALLAVAGLVAIALADSTGLSKAETERIWLPFDMWLLAATALLPRRAARWWLLAQAAAALLINHLLLTNW